jgi:hypothetical protein
MKSYCTLALAALLLVLSRQGQAAPEFHQVKTATPEQEATIDLLNRQIFEAQTDLANYYEDLRDHSCEDGAGGQKIFCQYYKIQENGVSLVPLTATVETFYGQRQRYMLNEEASIQWDQERPVSIRFDSRRGELGKGAVLIKRLSGKAAPAPAASADDGVATAPLNLVVNEMLSSGRGQFVNFRFATEAEVRDRREEIEIDGRKLEIDVVFVRDPNQKIGIMREYLRMLKLLNRRLDWMVRAANARRTAEIERMLRR